VACVGVIVQPAEVAREYLKDAPNVTVVELEIEDGWTRDWGPSVRSRSFCSHTSSSSCAAVGGVDEFCVGMECSALRKMILQLASASWRECTGTTTATEVCSRRS
jgi:hypothetical protein